MAKADFATKTLDQHVLNVEELLAASQVEYREIEVGSSVVRVGTLTAEELIEFMEANTDKAQSRIANIRMLVKSLVNEKNERIGTDAHVALFLKANSGVVNKIVKVVMDMNGITEPKVQESKKDSGGASTTASPSS